MITEKNKSTNFAISEFNNLTINIDDEALTEFINNYNDNYASNAFIANIEMESHKESEIQRLRKYINNKCAKALIKMLKKIVHRINSILELNDNFVDEPDFFEDEELIELVKTYDSTLKATDTVNDAELTNIVKDKVNEFISTLDIADMWRLQMVLNKSNVMLTKAERIAKLLQTFKEHEAFIDLTKEVLTIAAFQGKINSKSAGDKIGIIQQIISILDNKDLNASSLQANFDIDITKHVINIAYRYKNAGARESYFYNINLSFAAINAVTNNLDKSLSLIPYNFAEKAMNNISTLAKIKYGGPCQLVSSAITALGVGSFKNLSHELIYGIKLEIIKNHEKEGGGSSSREEITLEGDDIKAIRTKLVSYCEQINLCFVDKEGEMELQNMLYDKVQECIEQGGHLVNMLTFTELYNASKTGVLPYSICHDFGYNKKIYDFATTKDIGDKIGVALERMKINECYAVVTFKSDIAALLTTPINNIYAHLASSLLQQHVHATSYGHTFLICKYRANDDSDITYMRFDTMMTFHTIYKSSTDMVNEVSIDIRSHSVYYNAAYFDIIDLRALMEERAPHLLEK